jgi:hypothetical protein
MVDKDIRNGSKMFKRVSVVHILGLRRRIVLPAQLVHDVFLARVYSHWLLIRSSETLQRTSCLILGNVARVWARRLP